MSLLRWAARRLLLIGRCQFAVWGLPKAIHGVSLGVPILAPRPLLESVEARAERVAGDNAWLAKLRGMAIRSMLQEPRP